MYETWQESRVAHLSVLVLLLDHVQPWSKIEIPLLLRRKFCTSQITEIDCVPNVFTGSRPLKLTYCEENDSIVSTALPRVSTALRPMRVSRVPLFHCYILSTHILH